MTLRKELLVTSRNENDLKLETTKDKQTKKTNESHPDNVKDLFVCPTNTRRLSSNPSNPTPSPPLDPPLLLFLTSPIQRTRWKHKGWFMFLPTFYMKFEDALGRFWAALLKAIRFALFVRKQDNVFAHTHINRHRCCYLSLPLPLRPFLNRPMQWRRARRCKLFLCVCLRVSLFLLIYEIIYPSDSLFQSPHFFSVGGRKKMALIGWKTKKKESDDKPIIREEEELSTCPQKTVSLFLSECVDTKVRHERSPLIY